MIHRILRAALLLVLGTAAAAFAVTEGDTYDQVIAEKGEPRGQVAAGQVRILTYPDAVIKLKANVVVAIRYSGSGPARTPEPAASAQPPQRTPPPARPTPAVAPAEDGAAVWTTDLDTALGEARSRNCHVLILFTGSDWCYWCKRMEAEVLSTPEFARYARDKLVLLKLDYLRNSPQSEQARAENEEMQRRYNVRGFPTILIVDASGNTLATFTGYQRGGPDPFIQALQAYE